MTPPVLSSTRRDKIFSLPWLLVVVLLSLGFADLVRGGITWSAVLLTLAYLVAIPWALIGVRAPHREEGHAVWWAAGAGFAVFLLYLATLAPTTALWDASEYIAAAYTFGLPHPPGNPLFVIVGRAVSLLPIAPSVAVRLNLLAAASSAVSAGLWFLVAHRALMRAGASTSQARLAGLLAALIGATAFTVWTQSVVNEKVYTVALTGIALITWLMLRWSDDPNTPEADRLLLVVAYLLGLGYSNHMAGMLPLPAIGLLVAIKRPQLWRRPRLLLGCCLAGTLGLTPFATQPIRSAFNPPINEGEPTACRSGLAVSCTFSAGTWRAFSDNFNRVQYAKPALVDRQAPLGAQVGMWWLYFRWQWWRDAHGDHPGFQLALACVMFGLAIFGAWFHYQRDRVAFWYFGSLVGLMTLVLIYYLNFKYGASQSPALDVPREVRDRDYFYLWSFSALGVWIALGLVALWRAAGGVSRGRQLAAAPLLMIGVIPLVANYRAASRRNDTVTAAFARDLLNSVEPYGVLITAGDNDTFPLWYAQFVEGVRPDVTVAVTSLMNTDWFARGIIRRPPAEYPEATGHAVYRGHGAPRPTTSPLQLTLEEADSVPQLMPVREPLRFQASGIDLTIEPNRLRQLSGFGPYLERADLLALRFIADRTPQRPVYISRTAGSYHHQLGLEEQTLAQGLARKVIPKPDSSTADTVMIAGSGYLDVSRSLRLWESFEGPAAVIRKGDWVDPPSLSTVFGYIVAGGELAAALRARGDSARAQEIEYTVRTMAKVVRIDLTP